ncbi:MAG: hypothetical protein N4J56_008006 [Chroococcidiopsis sp. SAG 2025]|nr:hypothetical protein [Chroococcidiopsis sp. SAG 2025]MDV2996900.1 hypothetical protein [Chroococcidiopsis sp. SAG 2025]MDV2996989.1 hypothetical protein [Chroococcidiopsis sp. SAG 2025]MDV2997140.1 hypothetical protein [Chroococcidiopsis sp. SAG 2025]MDV2997151.1 hypothetical protein [Chroococcidiopsis sp. SAG 2025]
METIVEYAQGLVYSLLCLMPSTYQKASLNALFGLFLEAQGYPLPQHTQVKSASSLSRFLNHYNWSTRSVIRTTRQMVLQQVTAHPPHPSTPLRVSIDLTTFEKCGKFLQLSTPTNDPKAPDPWVRILNGKRGLHLVVLYLVVGEWRVPWSFRVWRGKGYQAPSTISLQVVGNGSNPVESGQGGHCTGRYGVWHRRVSQSSAKAVVASSRGDALQSQNAGRSSSKATVSPCQPWTTGVFSGRHTATDGVLVLAQTSRRQARTALCRFYPSLLWHLSGAART